MNYSCDECAHEGCCTYPCGGNNFESKWKKCDICGEFYNTEEVGFFDVNGDTVCENCYNEDED